MGRGHAGTRDGLVLTALPGRANADTGSGDGVILVAAINRVVAEVGGGVIDIGAAGRSSAPTRLAVEVGHGGDGQDLLVGSWYLTGEVGVGVAGRDHIGHAGLGRVTDCLVERVGIGIAAVVVVRTASAEAHVGYLDAVGGGVLSYPIDSAYDPRPIARPRAVEHPDRVQGSVGGDPDDAGAIVPGRHGAGDVRPVSVAVAGARAADAVHAPLDV